MIPYYDASVELDFISILIVVELICLVGVLVPVTFLLRIVGRLAASDLCPSRQGIFFKFALILLCLLVMFPTTSPLQIALVVVLALCIIVVVGLYDENERLRHEKERFRQELEAALSATLVPFEEWEVPDDE